MSRGQVYIDGKDVAETYGAYIAEGGFSSLLSYPPFKPVPCNDWAEEDGLEVDLSRVEFATREVQLRFVFNDDGFGYLDLCNDLRSRLTHGFVTKNLGRSWNLRLKECGNIENVGTERVFSAAFSFYEDKPRKIERPQPPTSLVANCNDGYYLDGVPLTKYGLRVLEGSLGGVLKMQAAKEKSILQMDNIERSGTMADKDITLKCLISGGSLPYTLGCYDSFFYDLTQPNERRLTVETVGADFLCYYKSSKVSSFYLDREEDIWLMFDVTLTVTRDNSKNNAVLTTDPTRDAVLTDTMDFIEIV